MLLLGCSQCVLLLLSCSELLNSQGVRSLEQLREDKQKGSLSVRKTHHYNFKDTFLKKKTNKPAAESCSQTIPLEPLRSPPESGSLHNQTGGTLHQLAVPFLPCSEPPGSESPQWGLCFGWSCVAGVHGGGAVPSSPSLSDWHPSALRLQWVRLDGFLGLDWDSRDIKC